MSRTPAPLERPVWHALASRQADRAEGTELARRFPTDVAPFAATVDDGPRALADLASIVPSGGVVVLLQDGEIPVPVGFAVDTAAQGVQMLATAIEAPSSVPVEADDPVIEVLATDDAAEMVALATLTRPGPFLPRTPTLGQFVGIRQAGRIVAMAGERFNLDGYTEVSGVCTHPDARGKGYAALLTATVARRILERGDTPILHAYASNAPAIRVYERLGFEITRAMSVRVLRRD